MRLALSIESENPGAANQTSLFGCNIQYPPMMNLSPLLDCLKPMREALKLRATAALKIASMGHTP